MKQKIKDDLNYANRVVCHGILLVQNLCLPKYMKRRCFLMLS